MQYKATGCPLGWRDQQQLNADRVLLIRESPQEAYHNDRMRTLPGFDFGGRETMDWNTLFDDIGAEIISAIIGALVTAAISIPVSYKAGKKSVTQKQRAGDNAIQTQIGTSNEQ